MKDQRIAEEPCTNFNVSMKPSMRDEIDVIKVRDKYSSRSECFKEGMSEWLDKKK